MSKKKAQRVKQIFNTVNGNTRTRWESVNQKAYDFANDNQLSQDERIALEEQGMPTFTINRISPVVEMLNFYATANNPRWQAIASEGSDTDVAGVISDLADYIWYNSEGSSLYSNAINDAVTKSIGYLQVDVDPNQDLGMGEVIIKQPEPFDVYVDPKSRDMHFRDAAFIMVRKLVPRNHLKELFPQFKSKVAKSSSDENFEYSYSNKDRGEEQVDFTYKDIGSESIDPDTGEKDDILELFELFEKIKIEYANVFYKIPVDKKQLAAIQEQVQVKLAEVGKEQAVVLKERIAKMQQAVQSGDMLPERMKLEVEKAQKQQQQELEEIKLQYQSQLQREQEKTANVIISKKEYDLMVKKDVDFVKNIINVVTFFQSRVKQTCVVGDQMLYETILPEKITEYPIVPIHFKWTGTPYPMSAVSPLVGKQQEINKSHQLLIHNASLGSSLRWMFEEGSVDTEYWEKYSSSPGALLPIRPGSQPPTPVQPAPLNNAFYSIVQNSKNDMEYLAGIYASMMGDTGGQHETYRGMLAVDEYGTRRIKQWLKNSIEPSLKQLGTVVMQYAQSIYTAHKVFRIVQPSALQESRKVEMNIPLYNDKGDAIGKSLDISTAKFDIRIIAGSTMPINRWAYLDELKQMLQLGVIDDVALLAETDLKDKEAIAKRKSLYSQLQGQISGAQSTIKDQKGTIETLERQVVQANIRMKVMSAEMEVFKKKEEAKGKIQRAQSSVEDGAKAERAKQKSTTDMLLSRLGDTVNRTEKNLGASMADANKRMQENAKQQQKSVAKENNKS
ncbi:MAG: putative portal protein [Prokaryotic dsDNA virus sp.]|nr:MAG: putative portal protein [Prokaryotic dsDNA virus sp.]|tara:strand:+ start:6772 stop:9132 length:2361 start_codon:yes stop_codon:yes gene_type:complete